MNGGSRDGRRACGGILELVGTSFVGVSKLYKNGCALGIFPRKTKNKRMNSFWS